MLSIPCWEGNKARTVLVDLVRRQPNAYAWMGLADDWMTVNCLLASTKNITFYDFYRPRSFLTFFCKKLYINKVSISKYP